MVNIGRSCTLELRAEKKFQVNCMTRGKERNRRKVRTTENIFVDKITTDWETSIFFFVSDFKPYSHQEHFCWVLVLKVCSPHSFRTGEVAKIQKVLVGSIFVKVFSMKKCDFTVSLHTSPFHFPHILVEGSFVDTSLYFAFNTQLQCPSSRHLITSKSKRTNPRHFHLTIN